MAIQLTKLTTSNLIDTVFNDITFKLGYYNTTQPSRKNDILYVEIYAIPNKNLLLIGAGKTDATYLTRLIVDTDATGVATFYLNDALSTAFTTYEIPSNELLQRDTTNYVGYYLKYGYVNYSVSNTMGYKKIGETDIQYALRGVLQDGEYLPVVDYAYAVDYLTHIPNNIDIHKNENTYLPFLLPKASDTGKGILVKGDFYYSDNTSDTNKTVASYLINQGGLFLLNVNPTLLVDDTSLLADFSVWLEYYAVDGGATVLDTAQAVYTATSTYTATCAAGYYGSSVTSTVSAYSNVSQANAALQASSQARENATAALTCSILYTSTKTATVTCQSGQYATTGGTGTATATSYDSQAEADSLAYSEALVQAQASLQCAVITTTYTSNKSYTASCPAGQYGQDVTATASATSYSSQQDADTKALAQATADANALLVCSTQQTRYTSTQSATLSCPVNYRGNTVYRTAYAESVISQADADNKASLQALRLCQDDIQCTYTGGGTQIEPEQGI